MRRFFDIGAVLFATASIVAPPLGGLTDTGQATIGIGILMATFWVTEAMPLAATSLLPIALFPIYGMASIRELSASYANPLIFLFLGGFLIAKAIEKCGLHRRLAFVLLSRSHNEPQRMIFSFMIVTAFLSLWISNTAATMVIAPIAASIVAMQKRNDGFAPALMLAVAFSATIGGMGSLIGTPPNAFFAAYMAQTHGIEIGFAQWMLVGLPVVLLLLPITWMLLARIAFTLSDKPLYLHLDSLGSLSLAEIRVAVIAIITAIGWISRPALEAFFPGYLPSDAGIAVIGALILFLVPSGDVAIGRLLDWNSVSDIRWDVLILFGGGLALASAIESTGVASWIGHIISDLQRVNPILIVFCMTLITVYLGEIASNTAMAAIFLPVAGATAQGLGTEPLLFALPIALAASIGFMLPVATPPNAIVFANSSVKRLDMLRAGVPLDMIGIIVALTVGIFLGPHIL